jgi:hypothetical protein
VKFEFEEFSTIEDVFVYLVAVAPYMKQVLPVSSYKDYVFSLVPLTPLSGDVFVMVYTKGSIEGWWSLTFLLKNINQSLRLSALIRIILLF